MYFSIKCTCRATSQWFVYIVHFTLWMILYGYFTSTLEFYSRAFSIMNTSDLVGLCTLVHCRCTSLSICDMGSVCSNIV